jgi:hypothetical protein
MEWYAKPLVRSVAGIVAGLLMTAFGISLALLTILLFARAYWNTGGWIAGISALVLIALAAFGVGGVGSGYASARIAGQRPMFHALAVPAVVFVLAASFLHPHTRHLLYTALMIGSCALGGSLEARRQRRFAGASSGVLEEASL